MQLRIGFEIVYECPQPTPMMLSLNVHSTRVSDLVLRDDLVLDPPMPLTAYRDGFGNWCARIVAPAGRTRIFSDALINDSGLPDPVAYDAQQVAVQDLPEETLVFLLGSRYCETDRLSDMAWNLFGNAPTGWGRVQAICDYVNKHVAFDYQNASPMRSALDTFKGKIGVCRDYAHLAVTFCRCMNIPARYCTGHLADIGVPVGLGDFAAWFEAYLDGNWYIFDPRNNMRRIGRVLMARGRDAADFPLSNSFGPNTLVSFRVWAEEVAPADALAKIGAVPAGSPA
jgi:transglutaminase-like putative cysteine protease